MCVNAKLDPFQLHICGTYPLNCILQFDNAVGDGHERPIGNLYSSPSLSSLSFHLSLFAAAERLANIDSGPYLPKLAFRQLCAKLTFATNQGNRDEAPVWKIWRVVSRRKGGERVRWERGDGHRLPLPHCCTLFSLMGTPSPHRTPELPSPTFYPPSTTFPIFSLQKGLEANLADN